MLYNLNDSQFIFAYQQHQAVIMQFVWLEHLMVAVVVDLGSPNCVTGVNLDFLPGCCCLGIRFSTAAALRRVKIVMDAPTLSAKYLVQQVTGRMTTKWLWWRNPRYGRELQPGTL